MPTRRRFIGSLGLAAGGVLSAGRASADTGTPGAHAAQRTFAETFVGRVQGSNAYIAILKDGRKVGGYVCRDGPGGTWIDYTWLRNGSAPLRSGAGKVVGRVTIRGDEASGTVEVAGETRPFSATRTTEEEPGLYFAIGLQRGRALVGGWIVHPDRTQRGAVAGVNTNTLRPVPIVRAPRLRLTEEEKVELPGAGGLPPPVVEPEQLVVINIIAILIGLLLPAVQKERK